MFSPVDPTDSFIHSLKMCKFQPSCSLSFSNNVRSKMLSLEDRTQEIAAIFLVHLYPNRFWNPYCLRQQEDQLLFQMVCHHNTARRQKVSTDRHIQNCKYFHQLQAQYLSSP
mmetsp:Transcript_10812/g.26155  ORF Transcript_10812/g.26155 Transcript_10812/m.26155 type:complete len:112 (+) Transcript_10812:104-439(+)